jgi:mannose/fructose/N-acetylgalactosamine-specific phosphotransferase system component IIB
MYENQTDFEYHLFDFGKKVEYIIAAEMAGKEDANEAYKKIKVLFEDLKKFRKQEKKQDHPLDYDKIPQRY